MTIAEKVAYLSGLMDGLGFDKDTKEAKMLAAIVDVLGEIAGELLDIKDELEALDEFTEALDEDVSALETLLDIDGLDLDDDDDDFDFDDDDSLAEVECPHCGYLNAFDPEQLWTSDEVVEIFCSRCKTLVFSSALFDMLGDDDEDKEDDDDGDDT